MDTGAAVWMYGQDWPLQGEIDVRNLAIIKFLIAIVDFFFFFLLSPRSDF